MSDLVVNPGPMMALLFVLALGVIVAILWTNDLSRRLSALERQGTSLETNASVGYFPAGETINAGDPIVLRDGKVYRA